MSKKLFGGICPQANLGGLTAKEWDLLADGKVDLIQVGNKKMVVPKSKTEATCAVFIAGALLFSPNPHAVDSIAFDQFDSGPETVLILMEESDEGDEDAADLAMAFLTQLVPQDAVEMLVASIQGDMKHSLNKIDDMDSKDEGNLPEFNMDSDPADDIQETYELADARNPRKGKHAKHTVFMPDAFLGRHYTWEERVDIHSPWEQCERTVWGRSKEPSPYGYSHLRFRAQNSKPIYGPQFERWTTDVQYARWNRGSSKRYLREEQLEDRAKYLAKIFPDSNYSEAEKLSGLRENDLFARRQERLFLARERYNVLAHNDEEGWAVMADTSDEASPEPVILNIPDFMDVDEVEALVENGMTAKEAIELLTAADLAEDDEQYNRMAAKRALRGTTVAHTLAAKRPTEQSGNWKDYGADRSAPRYATA